MPCKNLVFRTIDVPVTARYILEPKGILGRQFERIIYKQYLNNKEDVDKFIELYNKCETKKFKSRKTAVYELYYNLRVAYAALIELIQLYYKIAKPECVIALAYTMKLNNCKSKKESFVKKAEIRQNSLYYCSNYLFEPDITYEAALAYLKSRELPDLPHYEMFGHYDWFDHSVHNGTLINLGVNADKKNKLVKTMLRLFDITNDFQKSKHLDVRMLFGKVMDAACNLLSFYIKYLNIVDDSELEVPYLDFLEFYAVKDHFANNEDIEKLRDANSVYKDMHNYEDNDIWFYAAIAMEVTMNFYDYVVSECNDDRLVYDYLTGTGVVSKRAVKGYIAGENDDYGLVNVQVPCYSLLPWIDGINWLNAL